MSESVTPAAATSSTDVEDDPLPANWTKIASKKRPDKFYYFNAKTNQSLWEHPARSLAQEESIIRNVGKAVSGGTKSAPKKSDKVVGLKKDVQFKRKNLAESRMGALVKQLADERKAGSGIVKKVESPKKKPASPRKIKVIEVPAENPELKKTEVEKPVTAKPKSSPRKVQKRAASTESPKSSKKKSVENSVVSPKSRAKRASPKKRVPEAKPKPAPAPTVKPPAVEPLKKNFKIPKKPPEQVSSPILAESPKLEVTKVPTPPPKTEPVPVIHSSAAKLLNSILAAHSPKVPSEPPKFQSTPILSTEESSTKSPANDRLSKIRTQLAQEVAQQSALLDDEDAEMTDLSELPSEQSLPEPVEEMDWESIEEAVALQEVSHIRRSLGLKTANGSCLDTTIPEYRNHLLDQVSFQQFFFMVVDTNIFLSHLKALTQLLDEKHSNQPILILPYIVLQELDRIKHREQGRPLSVAASQSIRFLNERLKRRDPRVRGQSTLDAANTMIPIENPDDHIVNCCLQVWQAVFNGGHEVPVLLLSNDVNLRNKVMVSGVDAKSFGMLVADRLVGGGGKGS